MTTSGPEHVDRTPPSVCGDTDQCVAGREILQALYGAVKAAMVYEANNRAYRERADELSHRLDHFNSDYGALRIDYFNDFFFINGARLRYDLEFSRGRELAQLFDELQLGRLEFLSLPGRDDIDKAVFALAHLDRRVEDPFAALQHTWEGLDLGSIALGRIAPKIANQLSTEAEVLDSALINRKRAGRTYGKTTDLVREFLSAAEQKSGGYNAKARRVVHDLIDHIVRDETSLLEFTAIKDFDDYTYTHSTNVCIFAICLGLRLGLDRRRLSQLGFAALFHDVGKTKLPPELINKPETYTDTDWHMIHQHPVLGALTLAAMPAADDHNARAIVVAYEHHLNLDGSGYPHLREPRAPNLFSRIVAIADSYDAMTSGRVYMKARLSPDEALRRLLQQGGVRYDPTLLRALVHAVGIFPVGTFVRLNTGEVGIVQSNNPDDLYCPNVRLLLGPDGQPCGNEIVKLSERNPESQALYRHIANVVPADDVAVADALGIAPALILTGENS